MSNSVVHIPFWQLSSSQVLHLFVGRHGKKRPNDAFLILTCKSLGADGSTAIARYKTWRRFFSTGAPKISPIRDGCAMDLLIKKKQYICVACIKKTRKIIHAIFWWIFEYLLQTTKNVPFPYPFLLTCFALSPSFPQASMSPAARRNQVQHPPDSRHVQRNDRHGPASETRMVLYMFVYGYCEL